ncbi:uncharacterized protein TNCV_2559511 [Trichonephila clavipes]|nr:uncharacterized protein TNCV_2559511 [Trichonephila clavipes]
MGSISDLREGGFSYRVIGVRVKRNSSTVMRYEAVNRQAPNNSKNWQWKTEGDPEVVPFLQGITGAIFQQDNARPNAAKTVRNYCSAQHIQLLRLPTYSLVMLSIEHVWYLVGGNIARDLSPAALKDELLQCTQAIWNFLPQTNIQNLFDSMPRCIAAFIAERERRLRRLVERFRTDSSQIQVITIQMTFSDSLPQINLGVQGGTQGGSNNTVSACTIMLLYCKNKDTLVALHFKYDQARRRFIEWAQNEIAVVPDFHKRILFSDEVHFWLNGYVNKQNYRIWSEANPKVYVETPLHPEKLTVWCALWAGGIIGPYFFKNYEGHNVTVNGDRYRAMITNFFIPELNNHDVQELWFQQDGATCHTARATIDLLKDTFGDHLISRFGPVNWSPRSCDLTPLDYFLWGYVKSLIYADKPQTFDHLEDSIRHVIADILTQMLEKVIENWTSRLTYI